MTLTSTAEGSLFAQALDPANRHDPYPLYARLRETPVSAQAGTYVISTYTEIAALLVDPRISSDERQSICGAGALAASGRLAASGQPSDPPFIFTDPPDHDRLRCLVTQQFTPERVASMRDRIAWHVDRILGAQHGRGQLDIVDDLAYPLSAAVTCELLGVPPEDEPRFHGWAVPLAHSLDPAAGMTEEEIQRTAQAAMEMREYVGDLAVARRARPDDDLISGLMTANDGQCQMNEHELLETMMLLLVAGHETCVNLISNGMLALLRHPDALKRLRREPELSSSLVEEALRFDPPVLFGMFSLTNGAGLILQGLGLRKNEKTRPSVVTQWSAA